MAERDVVAEAEYEEVVLLHHYSGHEQHCARLRQLNE